jgi:hypothetical protein
MLKASQIINISWIYHEYHTLRKSVGQPGAFAAAVAEVAMAPPPPPVAGEEVAATRPPSAKAHEPCDAEVGTQGASVPIATRAAEVYLICLFLCTSLYCEFIAFLSYPARTRPLQQTCHSSSMAQQRNCKEPGSWIVSGWSLMRGTPGHHHHMAEINPPLNLKLKRLPWAWAWDAHCK